MISITLIALLTFACQSCLAYVNMTTFHSNKFIAKNEVEFHKRIKEKMCDKNNINNDKMVVYRQCRDVRNIWQEDYKKQFYIEVYFIVLIS